MEWRIIVPVLCLIGLLHLPGSVVAQGEEIHLHPQGIHLHLQEIHLHPQEIHLHPQEIHQHLQETQRLQEEIQLHLQEIRLLQEETHLQVEEIRLLQEEIQLLQVEIQQQVEEIQRLLEEIQLLLEEIQLVVEEIQLQPEQHQTITLINQVTSQFVVVYRQRYKNFYRMVINKFSQGSVVADTNLEFDSTNGTSPNATDVKDTLVQAVASGNLNLSVDTTNITTSAVPDSTTNGTNTTTTNTTSATTVAQVTTLSTTTVASQMNYSLTFKMTGLFVNDLSNSSSVAYGLMSTLVRSQLDGYFGKFTGYFNSFIRGFRSGSIIVDAGLSFNSSSNTANASTLAKSMASAVRNGSFALLIDPTSINVTDSSGYTGVLHLPGYAQAQANTTVSGDNSSVPLVNSTLAPNSTGLGESTTVATANQSAPTGNSPVPTGNSPVPTGNSPVPTGNSPVPTGNSPVPTGNSPVPTGNSPVPTGNAPVPTGNAPVPTGNAPVPTGNASAPTGNPSAPTGNPSAPTGNPSAPTGNPSAPTGNAPAPTGNAPVSAGNSITTGPGPKVAKINMVFKMSQTWDDKFSDLNNPATVALVNQVTTEFTKVYKKRYANFYRMTIKKFSQGSVVADTNLEFDNTNNTTPNAADVKDTLVQAVASGNMSLPVNSSEISAATVPDATTIGQFLSDRRRYINAKSSCARRKLKCDYTKSSCARRKLKCDYTKSNCARRKLKCDYTKSSCARRKLKCDYTKSSCARRKLKCDYTKFIPPPPKVAKVNLVFKMTQIWDNKFSDLTDPATVVLINQVTTEFTKIYKKRYANFYRMTIKKFSQGSVVADTNLEFDNTNNTTPNATDVKDTLVQAVASGNLSLPVNSSEISAAAVPDTPTNDTSTNTTTSTTPTTQVTTQVTTLVTTQVMTTVGSRTNYSLTFKLNLPFTSDLSNASSNAYGLLSTLIRTQLDKFFATFTGYISSYIKEFRSDPIIVYAGLSFNSSSTTNASTLAKSMAYAVRNGSIALLIDPTSINVTDSSGYTASNSPVLASMLTAVWMTMASLLLSAVIH
ncbi:hypothetical protein DNTS_020833 [Danionella cerebrum]|uniref:SEA domain-containing protein n=1 Tax=Danionella cerebrum TaxID=2873325 RepID=A0A553RBJ1_9TELE|nr:hypothetical protein DNTS_020833 [Danionella translucida]